jgi:dsDNA-specific endonuclease/ATPase MutS2
MAAARRGQGKLKRSLDEESNTVKNTNRAAINQGGKGQLVTGVTLPNEVNYLFYFRLVRCFE